MHQNSLLESGYVLFDRSNNPNTLYYTSEGLVTSTDNKSDFVVPFISGTKIPVFASESEDVNEYTIQNAAEVHDNSLKWLFDTFGSTEELLRNNLVARLGLNPGMRVLITGAGAGNDIPFITDHLKDEGVIYAQDISKQMIISAFEKFNGDNNGLDLFFSVSDAMELPFGDDYFDAAYHFGGINLFPDIRKGIFEMNRVVKDKGKIVISDEGISPWFKNTEIGKMLITNNPICNYEPPLQFLPNTAQDVKLSWELSNYFYVIEFTVSSNLPDINIDVDHVGTRGGNIRKRYYGQLEGVDPKLKESLYKEARELGMSRVDYIESILKKRNDFDE